MELGEVFGYVASGLVLATFAMRTMIPLRLLGIASNLAFITYGSIAGLLPVLLLHSVLLPLNVYRLLEMRRLIREVESASGEGAGLTALLPFMRSIAASAGTTLFRKGEAADAMYVLTEGRIHLDELDIDVLPGEVLGEVGMFASHGTRTATAVCVEDSRLQCIARDRARELVFQNPRFAFYLIEVVASRLVEDLRIIEERVQAQLNGQSAAPNESLASSGHGSSRNG